MKQNLLLFYLLLYNSLFCATEFIQKTTLTQISHELFLEPTSTLIGTLQCCIYHFFNTSECKDTTCLVTIMSNQHTLKIIPSIFKECITRHNPMRHNSLTAWLSLINLSDQDPLNLLLNDEGLMDFEEQQ